MQNEDEWERTLTYIWKKEMKNDIRNDNGRR